MLYNFAAEAKIINDLNSKGWHMPDRNSYIGQILY
jgi:hypothetical protein